MEVIGKALATIEEVGDDLKYGPHGGFTCIASTPSEDRDGDNLYQTEWKDLPEHLTVDLDHGMSVATTVGSGHPYFNADGNIQTDVSFSSIARAQEARTLIKEGHIRTVSVAFMTDKTKKSGEPRRELLNLGIVAIPSNREAVILDSKALDARAEELAEQKAADVNADAPRKGIYVDIIPRLDESALKAVFTELLTKAAAASASGVGGDGALVQAIHDASSHLGAACPVIEVTDEGDGASSGANKSAEADTKDLGAFEEALDQVLTPESSPEAPAPSDEDPAPASPDIQASKRARGADIMHMIAQVPK